MTDAAPPEGEGAADDHAPVDYERAKLIFLGRAETARKSEDPDAWITLLAEVGRYAVDRWSAEKKAASGKARRKAVNDLNWRDFSTLAAEAREALQGCRDRHADSVNEAAVGAIARATAELLAAKEKKRDRWWRLTWHAVELYKGFLAFLALVILAVTIKFVVPYLYTEVAHELELLTKGPDPNALQAPVNKTSG